MLFGEVQRTRVAVAQQFCLVLLSALPDRADRVNDVFRRHAEARRDDRLSDRTMSDFAAGEIELMIVRGGKNRAADAAARCKSAVRRVDNRVSRHGGDIPMNYGK